MSKVMDVLVKHGIMSAGQVADDDQMVADFMGVYTAWKAGTLTTNATIGAEIKKAFVRQDKREERKATRIAERQAKAK